ncbi:hypothetical protein GQ44DRAFT_701512 [Phaeosphaeriaceae sp. PMI808]|nr:hypothetical protein GQ44DRAFT_701512 [Phaeosphaeriaceae sp. PMI808]
MTRLILTLAAATALAPLVGAVKFSSPKAGATLTAGTAIEVKWDEGGDGPKMADLLTYELFLCAGGNNDGESIVLMPITTQGSFAVGTLASALVQKTVGEDSPANAYFLKMMAVGKTGGQLITYSDRFSYSGMTGKFPADAAIKKGLDSIDGTTGPATQDQTVKPGGAAPVAGDYGVEYTMQTGATRFAPMQPIPPTKITAKNTKPLYPTSSVKIATTRLPIPKIQTTLTQSQTFSVSSRENTVAPAPHATDDMAKFLNRWKD